MLGTGVLKYLVGMLQVSEAASSTPISRRYPLKTAQLDMLESSVSLMYEAGHPKPVLCDPWRDLVGRKEGGRFRMEGAHVYLWLIHMYCRNHHSIVITLQLK